MFALGVALTGAAVDAVLTCVDAFDDLPDPVIVVTGIGAACVAVLSAIAWAAGNSHAHRVDLERKSDRLAAMVVALGVELAKARVQAADQFAELIDATHRHSALMEQAAHRPQRGTEESPGRRRRNRPARPARALVLPPDVADMTQRLDRKLASAK
jgi:hypothetical protein